MRILKSALILMVLVLAFPAQAAMGMTCLEDWDYFGLPDLTADQKLKMDDLRMTFLRESMVREANAKALSVEAAVLLTAERPDAGLIQQKLDQCAKLSAESTRAGLTMVLGVKALLKKEQAKFFDERVLTYAEALVSQGFMGGGSQGGTGFAIGKGGQSAPAGAGAQGLLPLPEGQRGLGLQGTGPQGPTGGPAALVPCDGRNGPCPGGACPLEDDDKAKKKKK